MGKIIYSILSQDYGYENSGEQVKIEIVFKINGGVDNTITAYLLEGGSYTVSQIWDLIKAAWNAFSWGFTAPILTINHNYGIGTIFISALTTIQFQTMKVYFNENNPRSLELPMILGMCDYMFTSTDDFTLDLGGGYSYEMPFMGTWRLQAIIPTWQGFDSSISNWTPIKSTSETQTDISRKKISNGNIFIVRGWKIKIDNVLYSFLKNYDLFLDFASRGECTIDFDFDLFQNNTYNCYIWGSESGNETLLFDNEQLMSYEIGLIPSSNLEA